MKKLILYISLLLICTVAHAQTAPASAVVGEVKTASLKSFVGVDIDAPMKICFERVESEEECRIEYDLKGEEFSKFEFSVKDSILFIRERMSLRRTTVSEATVYHTSPLRQISALRASIVVSTPLKSKLVDIKLHSDSRLRCDIDCQDIKLTLSGQSTARLAGKGRYVSVSAAANSIAMLRFVKSLSVCVEASYGASVEVSAQERLEVKSVIGAKVRYYGRPSILRMGSSLIGGEVINMEDE